MGFQIVRTTINKNNNGVINPAKVGQKSRIVFF